MGVTVLTHLGEHTAEEIRRACPGAHVVAVAPSGTVPAGVRGEVLLTVAKLAENLPEVLDRGVRWVHEYGTGVDAVPLDVVFGRADRVLTCSRGASAVPISEWVLAQMLAVEKQLPGAWVAEPPELWSVSVSLGELHGKVLGVVGMGSIGQRVARLGLAFGMDVVGVRRSEGPPPFDGVHMAASVEDVAAAADHLVLAAPATPLTHHLVDERVLRGVRPGLHLVNVARGALVDQEALRAALDDGRVAVASLDVCTPEPLPAGHWLYSHPSVRLSPHVSWSSPRANQRNLGEFVANLRRWMAGEPLEGVVDREAGY